MSAFTPTAPTNAYPKTIAKGGLTATLGYYFGTGKTAISIDPNNTTTSHYFYDPFDRPTQTTYPIGWTLANYTSATQSDGYVPVADSSASTSCTSCRHRQVNLDSLGRKINEKLANAPGGAINVDTTYDNNGRVSSVSHPYVTTSDPSYVFEVTTYDALNRPVKVSHPDNQSALRAYGSNVASLGAVTVQQGSTTTYGYGYPIISADETGRQSQLWIDGFGRVIEVDEPSTNSATPGIGSVTVSGAERSITQTTSCPPAEHPCPTVTYYDFGVITVVVNGSSVSVNYAQFSTSTQLAAALANAMNSNSGYPVTAIASGSVVNLTAKDGGASTNFSLSASSASQYNIFTGTSFPVSTSGAALTGGSGGISVSPLVTNYLYDSLDNLTQVAQGVQSRSFAYDGLGRLTSRTTPEAGTENFFYTKSDNVSLCAGAASAVCRRTDARGIATTLSYDALSRLTSKSYSNGQGSVTYSYDRGGAAAFALGRRTSVSDPSGSETYTYNQMGWVTGVQKTIGTTTFNLGYQYNAGGQITQITYPSGRIVQQNVDSIGRPQAIVSGGTTFVSIPSSGGYNAAGQILTLSYGNGVTGNFAYSAPRQQMTSMNYIKGAQTYFSLQYYYQKDSNNCLTGPAGNNGQIGCIKDLVDDGRTQNFVYDALGRLASAVTNGSAGFTKWGLAENFDRYSNRSSQVVTAGSGPPNSLSFATTTNPPGGAYTNHPDGYSFDAAGNMLGDGVNTLTYDAENCLMSAGTAVYKCDSHGIRVVKALQGSTNTAYVFTGGRDIVEYDYVSGSNPVPTAPSREYIYFGAQLIATLQGVTPTYHHQDHLSVRVNTDANGNKIGEQGHYPYGELWYASNTTTKFIFTSYERDSESGNDYAMARYYINRFGRFCSADPVMGDPSDPQSWNRYAYVRNDPTNITDPTGQNWFVNLLVGFFKTFLSMLTGGKFGTIVQINWPGTPSTFPSAPGIPENTAVLLNSIYNPVSLNSPYVISEAGAFSGLSDPAKDGFDIDKVWKLVFPCTRSAAQMGRALVQNFTSWAATALKGPGDTTVQFFFWPGGPVTEGETLHPAGLIGSPTNGNWNLTTVKVSNVSDSGFMFTTVPSEHFFDGTVDFRIKPAATAGSVVASVTAKANWAHTWQFPLRDIIENQEDQAWTHLLGRIQQECQQKATQ